MRKGDRTRARILEAALQRFAEHGFAETSMRQIAADAGCSPGLAYRYFARKEDFAVALYLRLAEELAAEPLLAGTVGERFVQVICHKLALMEPRRATLMALFATAFDPKSAAGVLSPDTQRIREIVYGVVLDAVQGATPPPAESERLARVLYGVHLGLVLLWTQDRTGDSVNAALAMVAEMLPLAAMLPLDRVDAFLEPLLKINEGDRP